MFVGGAHLHIGVGKDQLKMVIQSRPIASVDSGFGRIFLCAGLKSSGSTWLYNAVIQLLEESGRFSGRAARMLPFYADSVHQFPPNAERASLIVVKTHRPSYALEFLGHFVHARVLITVREPRDAIASLMQRFGHPFEPCLKEVSSNAARLVDLFQNEDAIVLRYEDRFYERLETVEALARHLDLKISNAALRRIFSSLKASNVEKSISSLSARGAFGASPTPDSFDPRTHWHPGHVGDRQIGKYRAILSLRMQQQVLLAMGDYCTTFRYAIRSGSQGESSRLGARTGAPLASKNPIA